MLGRHYAANSDVPWIEWEQDPVGLVSEFTREVNEGQGHSARDLPILSRNTEFAPARYVLAAKRPSKDVFLVVGLSRDRAGLGKTAIWAMLSQQYAAPVLGWNYLRPWAENACVSWLIACAI